MTFRKTEFNIEGVKYFVVQDIFFACKKKDGSLIIENSLQNLNITSFENFHNIVYLYEDNSTLIRYQNKLIEKFETRVTPYNFYYPNKVIHSFDKQEINGQRTSKIAIYQLKPYKKLYELPHRYYGSGYRFENQYIQIQNERRFIKSLSLLTGEYEWEVDLGGRKCVSASKEPPEDASIQQIIGIWEHQLLVFLDNNQILSLDINKGKILWELPDFDVHFPTGPSVAKAMHFHWHLENGKLYILKHHQYFSVDLNTQEVALLWQNEDKTYTINHCTYTENYIYFTAYGKEIEISILGVFNRKTLQIDWLEKMIMPRMDSYAYVSFHQAPQVADNKLYVLDSGGTLHIFERES